MALGSGAGGVLPFDRGGADALVAREGGPPTALAGKDDALAGFAADADRAADPGAVVAFSGRGAAAARVESFRGVDAFVCRRDLESQSKVLPIEPSCVSSRGLTTAVAGHDPGDFSFQLEVVLDGFVICSAGGAKKKNRGVSWSTIEMMCRGARTYVDPMMGQAISSTGQRVLGLMSFFFLLASTPLNEPINPRTATAIVQRIVECLLGRR